MATDVPGGDAWIQARVTCADDGGSLEDAQTDCCDGMVNYKPHITCH